MTDSSRDKSPEEPIVYEITVKGQIDGSWSTWFSGMSIHSHGESQPLMTLVGPVVDQAALRGVLERIWNLNLDLISVHQLEAKRTSGCDEIGCDNTEGENAPVQVPGDRYRNHSLKEVYDV